LVDPRFRLSSVVERSSETLAIIIMLDDTIKIQ
jgi:hypothetical protein